MKQMAHKAIAISLATTFALAAPAFAADTVAPSPANDKTTMALPDIFAKAVRGCTTDGYIYRMPYNIVIDFDDIGAVPDGQTPESEQSLLYRLSHMNPDATLGVSGTDAFMAALKAMTGSVDSAMQSVAGRLIDEASSAIITKPVFSETMKAAVEGIAGQTAKKYGVGITIETGEPKDQGGRCAVAPPPPDQQPQPNPAQPAP